MYLIIMQYFSYLDKRYKVLQHSLTSNRGKVAPEEQRPETRDHSGREGITLSAVVCGALEDFSSKFRRPRARGNTNVNTVTDEWNQMFYISILYA